MTDQQFIRQLRECVARYFRALDAWEAGYHKFYRMAGPHLSKSPNLEEASTRRRARSWRRSAIAHGACARDSVCAIRGGPVTNRTGCAPAPGPNRVGHRPQRAAGHHRLPDQSRTEQRPMGGTACGFEIAAGRRRTAPAPQHPAAHLRLVHLRFDPCLPREFL